MRMEFDPLLVEKTVRLAVRRNTDLERALHREIDPVYRLADPEARDRAFTDIFAGKFRELRLDAPLLGLMRERPLIGHRCARCVVHEAARRSAEGAELFVRSDDGVSIARTLLVQMLPESVVSPERVSPLLRRELLHVSDMLSEPFGFRADDLSSLPPREQIVRDRYRVLWDLYVESRLSREGRIDDRGLAKLRLLFERAFTRQGLAPGAVAFDAALAIEGVTHDDLLAMAREPERLSGASADAAGRPSTGCPLCGFPTYDWFDFAADDKEERVRIITLSRPDWTPADGACRQCVETYVSGSTGIGGQCSACSGDSVNRRRRGRGPGGDGDPGPAVDVASGAVG